MKSHDGPALCRQRIPASCDATTSPQGRVVHLAIPAQAGLDAPTSPPQLWRAGWGYQAVAGTLGVVAGSATSVGCCRRPGETPQSNQAQHHPGELSCQESGHLSILLGTG